MPASRNIVGFSGYPASPRELAELRAKRYVHRYDLDFDPNSRMPPFRGYGQELPPPSGGMAPLLAFAVGIAAGWFALGMLLPKVGR
jgi:hypothetical protein